MFFPEPYDPNKEGLPLWSIGIIVVAGLLIITWLLIFCFLVAYHMCRRKPVIETYTIPHGPYSVVHVNKTEPLYDRQVGETRENSK